jgi:hypothetical protein
VMQHLPSSLRQTSCYRHGGVGQALCHTKVSANADMDNWLWSSGVISMACSNFKKLRSIDCTYTGS